MYKKFFHQHLKFNILLFCAFFVFSCSQSIRPNSQFGLGSTALTCHNRFCMTVGAYFTNGLSSGLGQPQAGIAPLVMRSQNFEQSFQNFENVPFVLPSDAQTGINEVMGAYGVSCVLQRCIIVGSYQSKTEGRKPFALISTNDGRSFDFVAEIAVPDDAVPSNQMDDTGLFGIQCESELYCVVVGAYRAETGPTPYILTTKDGGISFQLSSLVLPDDAIDNTDPGDVIGLIGLSCVSNKCTAVGQYFAESANPEELGVFKPLIVHSTDGGFTFRANNSVPLPSGAVESDNTANNLIAINCAGNQCVAVGQYAGSDQDLGNRPWALVSEDYGQTFELSQLNILSVIPGRLTGIYCLGLNCTAVGNQIRPGVDSVFVEDGEDLGGDFLVLKSTDGGKSFYPEMIPLPPDAYTANQFGLIVTGLYNIQCTIQLNCYTVGGFQNLTGNVIPVAVTFQQKGKIIFSYPAPLSNTLTEPEFGLLGIFSFLLTVANL